MADKPVYVHYVILPDATIFKKEGMLVKVQLVNEKEELASGDYRTRPGRDAT